MMADSDSLCSVEKGYYRSRFLSRWNQVAIWEEEISRVKPNEISFKFNEAKKNRDERDKKRTRKKKETEKRKKRRRRGGESKRKEGNNLLKKNNCNKLKEKRYSIYQSFWCIFLLFYHMIPHFLVVFLSLPYLLKRPKSFS